MGNELAINPKTCPFCGSPAKVESHSTGYSCGCSNLGGCLIAPEAGDCRTRQEAINYWNRREGE